ncbi:hypothetical protein EMVG_00242 [Emiliania huxleyi virus PS401]|jgi:hypothetical protein|nr:hypothetical protein EMVG_00242 [Emiliania huxleyi virus PS401]
MSAQPVGFIAAVEDEGDDQLLWIVLIGAIVILLLVIVSRNRNKAKPGSIPDKIPSVSNPNANRPEIKPSPDDKCDLYIEDRLQCGTAGISKTACIDAGCCYRWDGGGSPSCYHGVGSRGARWAERVGMMKLCLKRKKWTTKNVYSLSPEEARRLMIAGVAGMRGGEQGELTNAELLARAGCGIGGSYVASAAREGQIDCSWVSTYRCPSSTVGDQKAALFQGKHREERLFGRDTNEYTPDYDACCTEKSSGWSVAYEA